MKKAMVAKLTVNSFMARVGNAMGEVPGAALGAPTPGDLNTQAVVEPFWWMSETSRRVVHAHYRPIRIHPLPPRRAEQLEALLTRLSAAWFAAYPNVVIRTVGLLCENVLLSSAFLEVIVSDKAYIGVDNMLVPQKMGKGRLSEGNAKYNQWHQLVRSPAERVNARLRAYGCMRSRRFEEAVTTDLIKIVVALDGMKVPPPTSWSVTNISPSFSSRSTKNWTPAEEMFTVVQEEKQLIIKDLLDRNTNLDGKTSKNRKDPANSAKFKPFKLKYEMECNSTGKERSLCPCKRCKKTMKAYYLRLAKQLGVEERRAARKARNHAMKSLPLEEKRSTTTTTTAAVSTTPTTPAQRTKRNRPPTTTAQPSALDLLVRRAAELQVERVAAAERAAAEATDAAAREGFLPPDDFDDTLELLGLT